MAILSFALEGLDSGWTLEETRFDALNLLVGPSGAGKTRLLQSLYSVRRAALHGARNLESARWRLEIETPAGIYLWEAETRISRAGPKLLSSSSDSGQDTDSGIFVRERIERESKEVVSREESFKFGSDHLPKLDPSESAVSLLGTEEEMIPLRHALQQVREVREDLEDIPTFSNVIDASSTRDQLRGDLGRLRRDTVLPAYLKLYVLQEDHPELFARVAADFKDAFPTVEELRIATYSELDFKPRLGESFMANALAVGLREEGVERWVLHPWFSSGMAKTLVFLIETTLAPEGAVFLIDELENSLGANCLPEVASLMLRGLDTRQFIATSHHPRVINEIPFERWKLVTRKGSKVRVLDAAEIPALRTASSLERFTQLLNLPEYEEGVS